MLPYFLDQFSRVVEINQSKIDLKVKYFDLSFYPIFKRLLPKSLEKQLLLKKNSKKILLRVNWAKYDQKFKFLLKK